MVEVTQNLGLCVILSAVGGILEVFATAILAFPDAQAKEGRKWSTARLRLCLVLNVVLQIMASIVGNLFAPWFGPVAIVGPTFLSAQLVANMIIYGTLLGLECFTKDMKIGTCVIVTAAILLPVVGPQVQEDQDAKDLLAKWYAVAWNVVLISSMSVSGLALLIRVLRERRAKMMAHRTTIRNKKKEDDDNVDEEEAVHAAPDEEQAVHHPVAPAEAALGDAGKNLVESFVDVDVDVDQHGNDVSSRDVFLDEDGPRHPQQQHPQHQQQGSWAAAISDSKSPHTQPPHPRHHPPHGSWTILLTYTVLLTARATAFTINLSYSKVFVLPNLSTIGFVISLILKILSGAIMTGAIVVQSTAVQQSTFVPLNATCIILVNAMTGVILWEDWRVVESWLGYGTVFVQLVLGNYLLLGEIDLFGPSNRRYGRKLMLRRMRGVKELHVPDDSEVLEDEIYEEGIEVPLEETELVTTTEDETTEEEDVGDVVGGVVGVGIGGGEETEVVVSPLASPERMRATPAASAAAVAAPPPAEGKLKDDEEEEEKGETAATDLTRPSASVPASSTTTNFLDAVAAAWVEKGATGSLSGTRNSNSSVASDGTFVRITSPPPSPIQSGRLVVTTTGAAAGASDERPSPLSPPKATTSTMPSSERPPRPPPPPLSSKIPRPPKLPSSQPQTQRPPRPPLPSSVPRPPTPQRRLVSFDTATVPRPVGPVRRVATTGSGSSSSSPRPPSSSSRMNAAAPPSSNVSSSSLPRPAFLHRRTQSTGGMLPRPHLPILVGGGLHRRTNTSSSSSIAAARDEASDRRKAAWADVFGVDKDWVLDHSAHRHQSHNRAATATDRRSHEQAADPTAAAVTEEDRDAVTRRLEFAHE